MLVQDEATPVATGRCGEPVKLNLGDIGYYRVEYDAASHAALTKSFATMSAADRVNLLADSWALVEAGRAPPASYFDLVEQIGNDETRTVWDQVISTLGRINHLQRGRPERPAFQAYAGAKLRTIFDRVGWDPVGHESDDSALLRHRLIWVLGELGDKQILAEAKRRFGAFLKTPETLRPALRDAVTHLVGIAADRQTYDALIALARKTTNTNERVRYYSAAASARDPALASETLARTLTDELPTRLSAASSMQVAAAGEQSPISPGPSCRRTSRRWRTSRGRRSATISSPTS